MNSDMEYCMGLLLEALATDKPQMDALLERWEICAADRGAHSSYLNTIRRARGTLLYCSDLPHFLSILRGDVSDDQSAPPADSKDDNFDDYDAMMEDAAVGRRLEEIFAAYPHKKLPADLVRDIAVLKKSNCRREDVISDCMDLIHAGADIPREELLLALELIGEYLLATATGHHGPLPILGKLRAAVLDLEKGIVDPLLRPKKIDHRLPDTRYVVAQKMMAAAACDALINYEGRARSADLVARVLSEIRFSPSGRPATAGMILHWRQKFKNDETFKTYNDLFKAFADTKGCGPQWVLEMLSGNIRDRDRELWRMTPFV